MEKLKVQISFALNADLVKVRKQLEELAKDTSFEFYSCFPTREQVISKGLDTAIVDILHEVLGNRHTSMLAEYNSFDNAILHIRDARIKTARIVNKMFVLDANIALGVASEMELFTQQKLILLY